ncbi:MAG: CGGC domain-containing protein [Peptococcaceae bacterium]|nr:CGGC domain-containing protein [Peptococcaceae bacterium]
MARIVILSCKKIKDVTCVSCMKCFKAIKERAGEFGRYSNEEIDIVAMGDCGDCPGLVMPKVGLIVDLSKAYDRPIDYIHLGSCIKKAVGTAKCPIDLTAISKTIEEKTGIPVIIGTHPW